jgi:hypothetical protein
LVLDLYKYRHIRYLHLFSSKDSTIPTQQKSSVRNNDHEQIDNTSGGGALSPTLNGGGGIVMVPAERGDNWTTILGEIEARRERRHQRVSGVDSSSESNTNITANRSLSQDIINQSIKRQSEVGVTEKASPIEGSDAPLNSISIRRASTALHIRGGGLKSSLAITDSDKGANKRIILRKSLQPSSEDAIHFNRKVSFSRIASPPNPSDDDIVHARRSVSFGGELLSPSSKEKKSRTAVRTEKIVVRKRKSNSEIKGIQYDDDKTSGTIDVGSELNKIIPTADGDKKPL